MSHSTTDAPQVILAPGLTGTGLFHKALLDAQARFPSLAAAKVPNDPHVFKRKFADILVAFEAARAGSSERAEIAKSLADYASTILHFGTKADSRPLSEHLKKAAAITVELKTLGTAKEGGYLPETGFRGTRYSSERISQIVDLLERDHLATKHALNGLRWSLKQLDSQGRLSLKGQRFAVLGAGAELAPTQLLLAAGAEVLWLDRQAPPAELSQAGALVVASDAHGQIGDILAGPERVLAALLAFTAEAPAHVGLYAYAPGRGRELRLAQAMNDIVAAIPEDRILSRALYISPTTPQVLLAHEREVLEQRRKSASFWKKGLEKAGLLAYPGCFHLNGQNVSCSIVALQGTTYQAAQYLSKMMVAEAWGLSTPSRIAANIAPITNTRSLEHPLFTAGFLGARNFFIEIFEPETTRTLGFLLALNDMLNPERASEPGPAKSQAVTLHAIHGGSRVLPWLFDGLIRVAAVIGLGKRPSLALDLVKKKKKSR